MKPTMLNFSDVYERYMEKRYLERLAELRRNENLFSTDYSWYDIDSSKKDSKVSILRGAGKSPVTDMSLLGV